MKRQDDFTFNGFEPANTTPVPDILFDELLSYLTGAELKVLLYIIRRTRGFKKETDAISLTQFQKGITTRDGKQLDKGCGLDDRQTIINALASLEKKRCIVSEKGKTSIGDNAVTVYRICFRHRVVGNSNHLVGNTDYGSMEKPTTVVDFSNHGSSENQLRVVGNSNPQETVLQETELQEKVIPVESNGESAERTTYASPHVDASHTLDDTESHSSDADEDSPRLQESMDGLAYSPGTTGMTTRLEGELPHGHYNTNSNFHTDRHSDGSNCHHAYDDTGQTDSHRLALSGHQSVANPNQRQATSEQVSEGEPHHEPVVDTTPHPHGPASELGAAPTQGHAHSPETMEAGNGRDTAATRRDVEIDPLSRAWQEIGDREHEDILQVLRPSGVPDDNDVHGAIRRGSLDSHGTLGTADAAVVHTQKRDAQGRSQGTSLAGDRTARGGSHAADGKAATDRRLDEQGDDNADIHTDRDTRPHPGDNRGDTGRQPTQETIEQTSSFPLAVEPGHSGWGPMPGAPVPVVPSHDRGTTPGIVSPPMSPPVTPSTAVQAGALPASSFPLSPTNGQGTTFSAVTDTKAKGQEGKRTGKRKAEEPTKSDTKEIQKRIDTHRGYPLEEKVDIIRERQAVKTWCGLHTLEQYEMVMDELKRDSYWGKSENYYRIGGLTLLRETSRILARVERRQASNLRIVPPPEPVVDKSKLFNMEHIVLPRKGASR